MNYVFASIQNHILGIIRPIGVILVDQLTQYQPGEQIIPTKKLLDPPPSGFFRPSHGPELMDFFPYSSTKMV